jgi:hypothetical protein
MSNPRSRLVVLKPLFGYASRDTIILGKGRKGLFR